jgi:tetratricopeptide (TPR) repeat protein
VNNAASLNEPVKSGIAKATDNTIPSNLTAIQKLQADFDALAKKGTPDKDDWKSLYDVCSGLFEIRDFSRVFSCAGVAEKWQEAVGYEPAAGLRESAGYPTHASVTLIEARANFDTGNYSQAIELANKFLGEDEKVHRGLSDDCKSVEMEICYRSNFYFMSEHTASLFEVNVLLATAFFIEGKRDESFRFQRNIDRLAAYQASMPFDKEGKARSLAFRARLYLATERYDDALKLIGQDSFAAERRSSMLSIASK